MSKEEIEGILRYMDQMEYVQMKIDDLIFESMPKPKAKVSTKKKVITKAKKGDLNSIRMISRKIRHKNILGILLNDIAPV